MAGAKTPYDATYLTEKALYRTVTKDDEAPDQSDPVVPVIRLDIDTSRRVQKVGQATAYQCSQRAYNGQLVIYALIGESEGLTINLWAWAGVDGEPSTETWALAGTVENVTENTQIFFRNIPANKYCVTVTGVGENNEVVLVEQHSE